MKFKEWLQEIEEAWYHPMVAALSMGAQQPAGAAPAQAQGANKPNIARVQVAPKGDQQIESMYKTLDDQITKMLGGQGQQKFQHFTQMVMSQVKDQDFLPGNFPAGNEPKFIHSRQDLAEKLSEVQGHLLTLHNHLDRIVHATQNPNETGFDKRDLQNVKAFRARNMGEFMATIDTLSDLMDAFELKSQDAQKDPAGFARVVQMIIMVVDNLYSDNGFVRKLSLALTDLERMEKEYGKTIRVIPKFDDDKYGIYGD